MESNGDAVMNGSTVENGNTVHNHVQKYSRDEVEEHNDESSCWIIIENNIIDITDYLEEHPGGPELIMEYAGKDATKAFKEAAHSKDAKALRDEHKIGELNEEDRDIGQKKKKKKKKKKCTIL